MQEIEHRKQSREKQQQQQGRRGRGVSVSAVGSAYGAAIASMIGSFQLVRSFLRLSILPSKLKEHFVILAEN
jgi:hypothetical protein